MISHLTGKLLVKSADEVVVSCSGVGYGLAMAIPSINALGQVGDDVSIWVHTHISQDILKLFGFLTEFERKAFRILMGANGVGPKMALSVLSVFTVEELVRVVADRDVADETGARYRSKEGRKNSSDLSGKWPEVLVSGETSSLPASEASIEQEIILALTQMGHKEKPAKEAAQAAIDTLGVETELSALVWQKPFARARRAGPSSLTQRGFSARSAPTPLEMRKATCNIKAG